MTDMDILHNLVTLSCLSSRPFIQAQRNYVLLDTEATEAVPGSARTVSLWAVGKQSHSLTHTAAGDH